MQDDKTQIALTQQQVDNIDTMVNKIMDNHLPHIQAEVEKTNDKFDKKIDVLQKAIVEVRISIRGYVMLATGALAVLQILISFWKK